MITIIQYIVASSVAKIQNQYLTTKTILWFSKLKFYNIIVINHNVNLAAYSMLIKDNYELRVKLFINNNGRNILSNQSAVIRYCEIINFYLFSYLEKYRVNTYYIRRTKALTYP